MSCPGCGAHFSDTTGPVHAFAVSSPACFAAFGALMARDYQTPLYQPGDLHQLRVDAWLVQHPGGESRSAVRSIALSLMTLKLFIEDGVDPARGPRLHAQMASWNDYCFLAPPASRGAFTVADVIGDASLSGDVPVPSRPAAPSGSPHRASRRASASDDSVWQWARSAWTAWAPHHAQIAVWCQRIEH